MFIYTVFALAISNAIAYEMKMNTLYLTAAGNSPSEAGTIGVNYNSVATTMLDSYGMNYDIVQLTKDSFVLEKDNVALYNAIVIDGASQNELVAINKQIEDYQRKYKVRVAYLNCEPNSNFGFESVQTVAMRNVTLTDQGYELAKKYQMNGKDVTFDVGTCVLNENFQCIQFHHYEVKMNQPNVKPLLKYTDVDSYAGALVDNNGVESIHFWIPYVDSHSAYFTSHLWISWVNYGLIDGNRRLYFEIQIDDYFTDNCFNSSDCSMDYNIAPHYRTSVKDMENIIEWQKDISKRLPNGSDIKIELAINGIHILTKADHKQYEAKDWTYYNTEYNYKKPPTEHGSVRWGENIDSDWDDSILQNNDPLYKFFKNPDNQDNFFWLTHTFSHEKLDFASYYDTDVEMKLNIKMSSKPYLGMYERPCYSQHSIVTPEISGLHNSDALKALSENQVYYAVGDTSRTDLSPANFYLPFVTNMTTSNFDGFYAIPRQPPQIYWDCSTIEQNLAVYESRYGHTIEWNDHLDEEATLHVKNFLKLRHDPYMFHEGNLRNEDFPEVTIGKGKGQFGLMQQWVERIAVEYEKYLNWPIISIKMDDLAATYLERLSRVECKPQYTMVIDDDSYNISEIKVKSTTGECQAPILAIRNVNFDDKTVDRIEQIGLEPQTAWVNVSDKKEKVVKFKNNIKWSDDAYTPRVSADVSASILGFTPSKLQTILFIVLLSFLIY